MRTFIFQCVAALVAVGGLLPAGAQDYFDLTEAGTSTYSTQIETGKTLRKYGAGTITMNRSGGNGQTIAGLQVCEGTLILTGAGAWNESIEGYFMRTTGVMEVQSGAVLQTSSTNAAINRETPVWLNGGTLNVYHDCFLNNIRLTGGTIQDDKGSSRGTQTNRWRACNGVDITVDGGAKSLIAADLCLVKWNDADDKKVNFIVGTTGDASGIDLDFTGAIYDHQGGYGGNYLVKQGDGVMQLSYANNAWTGGSEVQAGTLQFTSGNSLGTGGVTVNGGTLKSLAAAGSSVPNAVTMGATGGTISANPGNATTFASLAGTGALQVFGSVGFAGNGGYTGNVTVGDATNTATLALSNGATGTFSAVLNAGSSLRLADGGAFTLASLTGSGNVTTSGTSATTKLSLGSGVTDANFSETYTGQLATNIALVKEGVGTLVLQRQTEGVNVGNGQRIAALTVNAGVVTLIGSGNWGDDYFKKETPITVNQNGRLNLGSKYAAGFGSITVDGGTLHFGATDTFASNLTLKNGATVTASNGETNASDFNSFRVGYAKTGTVLTVDGTSASTIQSNITLVNTSGMTDVFYIDVKNTSANLVMSGAFRDYASLSFHGMNIEKRGAGRLVLNRAGGNQLAFEGKLLVTEGSVEFATTNFSAGGTGYFPNNQVIVSNGAKAYVTGYCNLNQTPITIQGDNSLLQISNQNYANAVTLTDGGDIEGTTDRMCMGWFMDGKITVNGTVATGETGSTISGGAFQFVVGNPYKAIFDVSRTGAACDLVVTSRITDHDGHEGLPFVKTGEGSMKIVNNPASSNTFAGPVDIQAGKLIVEGGGNVLGTKFGSVVKSLTVGESAAIEISSAGLDFPGSYTLNGVQISQIDASGDTPMIGTIITTGNVTFGENATIALVSDDVLDWMYFDANPITLVESTGTITGWENIHFDTSGLVFNAPDVSLALKFVPGATGGSLQTEIALPEPGSVALLLFGTFGILILYRKRRIYGKD